MPVKRLSVAKSRLSPYGDPARRALALAFAADVVAAALACPGVEQVLVVTSDPDAGRELARLGARTAPDDPESGLNAALERGARLLRAGAPGRGVAAVSADLPALRPQDLADVLAAVLPSGRALVADLAGTGTTVLAAAGDAPLGAAFGPGSRDRHRSSGAVQVPAAEGVRVDVDTPADLQRALALGVGPRTAAAAGSAVR